MRSYRHHLEKRVVGRSPRWIVLTFQTPYKYIVAPLFCLGSFVLLQGCQPVQQAEPGWPALTQTSKPWTRWWWHGSALTKEGITAELEAYQKAGLGGVEITPIYGVYGAEEQFITYLSPQWMELLTHTLSEAERLDLGVDMATGTGWPFGGPWVTDDDASKNLQHLEYALSQGETLKDKIVFVQQPYLRAVGSQIYEVHQSFSTEKTMAKGTRGEPFLRADPKRIDIKSIKQPIKSNDNLQALAIDQVVFERRLPLQLLMAYGENGQILNLTDRVDKDGTLDWVAPTGHWKLHALFPGWHGKMVERAGPGGEGFAIDHFSALALKHYLNHFDSAFSGYDLHSLRAFFNDSYEVDDARGAADWTPDFLDAFRKMRGYNLEDYLPALFGKLDPEMNRRILCDYRETISDLVLQHFTQPWKSWAHGKSAIIRNQAHGSPSNILDLYATVDIPEIEGVESLRIKMASSAGHVTGKKLVSSESATWLNEHFESNLADIKAALDRFMLHGVNHIFYHGTSYSPPDEPWPGRLFYAAVHLNPRNSLWSDFDALNEYVARCQSFLQDAESDNDVLLYFPIYDRFSTPGPEMIEHFDGLGKQFEHTAFKRAAESMLQNGYSFDYISDKQIEKSEVQDGDIRTESGRTYQVIVIPHGQYIPANTLEKIMALAEQGATVIFLEGAPDTFSGFQNFDNNKKSFDAAVHKLQQVKQVAPGVLSASLGSGKAIVGDSMNTLLAYASVRREEMIVNNIQYIRKKRNGNRTIYLVSNPGDQTFEGWLPLSVEAKTIVGYDPMSAEFGGLKIREKPGHGIEVFIQLKKQETMILEAYLADVAIEPLVYYAATGNAVPLTGNWGINFIAGGPEFPPRFVTDTLSSWTSFGGEAFASFSGTATYSTTFAKPDREVKQWLLDLGQVHESAEVFLNGQPIGTLIGPVYQIRIDGSLLKADNRLEINVSNLMANRIADLDRRKVLWKKFYNVNFPARKSENRKHGIFDASDWTARDSGLLGPVRLVPLIPLEPTKVP